MKRALATPIAACLLALAACAGSGAGSTLSAQSRPSPTAQISAGKRVHIAVIVMENQEYGDIIGQSSTPYINGLASQYGLATESFAITHPSLPNYLALTGGSTHGISSDCTKCSVPGTGLAGQLSAKHISWRAYMEDLPHSSCYRGDGPGGYAKRHNPFIYYRGIAGKSRLCRNIVPLTRLASDERHNRLPRFVWITPNLCHDMHDCDPSAGDHFLAGLVPGLLKALGRNGLLFLTWDEGSSNDGCCRFAGGGHIATIVAGAGAKPHAQMGTAVDHYSVLRTIEDLYGLRRLGSAGCSCTPSLQPLLGP